MLDKEKACLETPLILVVELVCLVKLQQEVDKHQNQRDRLHNLDLDRQLHKLSLQLVVVQEAYLVELPLQLSQVQACLEDRHRLNKMQVVLPSQDCLVKLQLLQHKKQNQVFLVNH